MQVQCPSCRRKLSVKDSAKGESVTCPHCQTSIPLKKAGNGQPGDLLGGLLQEVRHLESAQPAAASKRAPAAPAAPAPEAPSAKSPPKPAEKQERDKPEKGHFPQRTSKAYQRGPSPHRGQMLAVIAGVLVIAFVGTVAIRQIRSGIKTQSVRVALKNAQDRLPVIREKMKAGEGFLAKDNFKDALDAYCDVISMAQPVVTRLRGASENLKPGKLADDVQTLLSELTQHLALAHEKSEDPNVKFRAQGLVDFDGEWVTPEQEKALFEAKMQAEGRQLYEGKYLTEAEIHRARGEVRYNGLWLTPEQLAELRADNARTTTPPVPAPAPPTMAARTEPTFDSSQTEWVLDDFEKPALAWSPVQWGNANPCVLTRVVENGSGQLKIALKGGPNDKSAIVLPMKLDFTSRWRLRMDITNNCGEPLRLAVAVQTNTYYESRWIHLKPGLNKNVSFDLRTGDYKCAATNWSTAARIGRRRAVTDIFLLFYNTSGEVLLDNVSAVSHE